MLRKFLVLWFMACSPAYAVDYLLFAPGQDEPVEHRVADKAPVAGVDMPATWKALVWVLQQDKAGATVGDYRQYRDKGPKGARLYTPPEPEQKPVANLSGFLDEVVRSGLFSSEEILQILVVSKLESKEQRDKFILLFLSQASPEKQAALAQMAASNNIELPQGGR